MKISVVDCSSKSVHIVNLNEDGSFLSSASFVTIKTGIDPKVEDLALMLQKDFKKSFWPKRLQWFIGCGRNHSFCENKKRIRRFKSWF
mgnify:CR=1 FL=1